jgi:hypothetical protein
LLLFFGAVGAVGEDLLVFHFLVVHFVFEVLLFFEVLHVGFCISFSETLINVECWVPFVCDWLGSLLIGQTASLSAPEG